MKFNTRIPKQLFPHFEKELNSYQHELKNNHLRLAWNHLERAHIIGQQYPYHHSLVHWKMLQFGMKIKNRKEVLGQLPRLIFGGVKSFVGTVPLGNPGGANVPPLKTFPINDDLQAILSEAETTK